MVDIHLAHVQAAEKVLNTLRDPNVVLEKVASQVGLIWVAVAASGDIGE